MLNVGSIPIHIKQRKMIIHDLFHFLVGRNLENACRLLVFITYVLSIGKVITSWLLLEVVIIGLVVD
jgi:hypothetical protein